MGKYNYYDAMREDIKNYIAENYTAEELSGKLKEADNFGEALADDLWTADSVTGNSSGSYTLCRAEAADYVKDNLDILQEALKEFCIDAETIADKFLSEDWEYFDVTIRCYILGGVINDIVNDIAKDLTK